MIRTLYVDDDPTLLDLAKEFLESENDNLSVTTCISAKDALNLMRGSSFDVIISDYQMPLMSGIELLKELRSHGVDIPFILFTGRGREEIAIDALNNGADFFLSKGGNPRVQFTELMNLVRHMVMKREAIEALKHNAERFRAMIENSMDIIVILNADGVVRYASPSVKKVLGVGTESMTGRPLDSFIHKEDLSKLRSAISNNGPTISEIFEVRMTRGDSTYGFFEGSLSRTKDGDGKTSFIFNARDITKRHKAEEMRRESEERYHTIFDSIPSGMMLLSDTVLDCNAHAQELLAMERPFLLGSRTGKLTDPAEEGTFNKYAAQALAEDANAAVNFIWKAKRGDGKVIPLQTVLKKVRVNGQPRLLMSFTEEIPPPAPSLSLNEETSRAFLATTTDAVILLDKDGIVSYHSPHAGKMFGHGPELSGVRLLDLTDLKDQKELAKDLEELRRGTPVSSRRYRFTARDGHTVHAELSARLVPSSRDLVCVFRDVTGNVLAEEQAIDANRHLAEVVEMLRQDVSKHVIALVGQLQMLQFHYRENGARGEVDRAIEQAERVLGALDTARSYSLLNGRAHHWVVLPDMMDAVREQIGQGSASLHEEVRPYEILADPFIGNALQKLVQHMLERGTPVHNVWIATKEENGTLEIVIEDDGVGYSSGDLNRLLKGERPEHPLTFVTEVARDSSSTFEGSTGPDGLRFRWTFRSGRWRRMG